MCEKPTQIGEFLVPKGTFVYVLFHALHNSARYWKDPGQFRPDRWMEKTAASSSEQPGNHSKSKTDSSMSADSSSSGQSSAKRFLPFSDGPRSCVAQVLLLLTRTQCSGFTVASRCFLLLLQIP